MKKFSLLLVSFLTIALGANADELEFGKWYPEYQEVSGTITVPEQAHVYVLSDAPTGFLLDGAECTSVAYVSGGSELCWMNVEPGTHTLTNEFPFGRWKVWYTSASAPQYPELTEISPAENQVLTSKPNSSGDIIAYFHNAVTLDRAYLRTAKGVTSADLEITNQNQTAYWFTATPALVGFYNTGAISVNGGDEVVLVIEGITSVSDGSKYNDTGLMEVHYIMAPKPIDLIDTNIYQEGHVLSFYPAGDPRGIFSITLSGTVNTSGEYKPHLELSFGDVESDHYFFEDLPGVVSTDPRHPEHPNNMLTFDLTGKNRLPQWLKAGTEEDVLAFKVFVYDVTGQPAEGAGIGAAGTYNFSMFPKFLDKINVDYQFTPADGSLLANVDNIELWLSSTDFYTSFSGIAFKYDTGIEETIPFESLAITTDDDGTVIMCPVPKRAKTEPVEVYMSGIVSTDGYSHDIRASYNKFAILFTTFLFDGDEKPVAGEQFDYLPADPVHAGTAPHGYLHVGTTFDTDPDFALVCDGIFDGRQPLFDSPMTAVRTDDGSWWFAGPIDDVDFELNKEYVIRLHGEAPGGEIVGTQNVVFYSSQNAFAYSLITAFDHVTPGHGGNIAADDPSFTVTFDGPVKINPKYSYFSLDGSDRHDYASIVCAHPESAEENLGYDYEWVITLPAGSVKVNDALTCYVAAYDVFGMVIPGHLGTKSKDALVFNFGVSAPASAPVLPADADGYYNVYDLRGVKVLATPDDADVRSLAPGVYIINGVKCLIQ